MPPVPRPERRINWAAGHFLFYGQDFRPVLPHVRKYSKAYRLPHEEMYSNAARAFASTLRSADGVQLVPKPIDLSSQRRQGSAPCSHARQRALSSLFAGCA